MCKEGYGCNVSIIKQNKFPEYFCSWNWILYLVIPLWFTTDKQAKAGRGEGGALLTVEGSVTSSFSFYKWQYQSSMIGWAKNFISAKWRDPQRRSPQRRRSLYYKQRWGCSLTTTEVHVCSKPMRKHTPTAKSKRESLKNLHSRT